MKRLLTILLGCSLAITAMAQQDEEQQKDKKDQKAQQETAAKPDSKADRKAERQQMKVNKMPKTESSTQAATTAAPDEKTTTGNMNTNANATTNGAEGKGKHARKERAAARDAQPAASATAGAVNAETTAPATTNKKMSKREAKAAKANAQPSATVAAQMTPAAQTNAQTAPTGAANAQAGANAQTGANLQTTKGGKTGLAGPAKIQQGTVGKEGKSANIQAIKTQSVNFHAQARPQQIPSVTFNQGYRIQGAQQWQGPQYEVFRSYQPEMHDSGFYRSRYSRVETFGGGAYYLNQGYWYPAWGYDQSAQYYPYDGPIYVGRSARTPDQVIAQVQSALQQMGYYRGEVDGLVGPMTREALTGYQEDHGLYTTATIDEPTLNALDLG